jgi:hypothetical protein
LTNPSNDYKLIVQTQLMEKKMTPQFIIFVETAAGQIISAFTWCRDEASGVARGRRDAVEFGHCPIRVWAQPISVANE